MSGVPVTDSGVRDNMSMDSTGWSGSRLWLQGLWLPYSSGRDLKSGVDLGVSGHRVRGVEIVSIVESRGRTLGLGFRSVGLGIPTGSETKWDSPGVGFHNGVLSVRSLEPRSG